MRGDLQDNPQRRGAQTKKFTPAKPAADPEELHFHSQHDARLSRRQRPRIRKLFSRQLWPPEVDFLLEVWEAGNIRAADCPKLAVGLLQRGWIERDGRTVRLSEETRLLLAEDAK